MGGDAYVPRLVAANAGAPRFSCKQACQKEGPVQVGFLLASCSNPTGGPCFDFLGGVGHERS